MVAKRKVPLRKCLASGEMKPKKEMIRVVRSKEGEVSVDLTGKKPGRGAYVSRNREAVLQAKQKNLFASQLQARVTDDIYDEIIAIIDSEGK